jgi:hypothetical protein
MRYRSRTGFGDVRWPWWHDALVVLAVVAAVALAGRLG